MIPYTVEIKGRIEPIDVVKIAVGESPLGDYMYHLVTPDGRIATVEKNDILVVWDNEVDDESHKLIDKLIKEGRDRIANMKPYIGVDVQ